MDSSKLINIFTIFNKDISTLFFKHFLLFRFGLDLTNVLVFFFFFPFGFILLFALKL